MASRPCSCIRIAGCALLCFLLCVPVSASRAQSLSTLIRSSGSSSGVAVSKSLQVSFPLDEQRAFFVKAEYVRDTPMPDDLVDEVKAKHTWKLKAVPITVGYTQYLTSPDHTIVPTIGLGLSYYFCRTKQHAMATAPFVDVNALGKHFEKRYGMGYGAEATFGLRADLNRSTFVMAQSRARYVDGLAFTEGDDLNSRFVKFDFSIGVGFRF